MVDQADGPLQYNGRPVKTIAYIYCVGSRQGEDVEGGHPYCSRYCCTAAVHAALEAAAKGDPALRQYHLYRDMRTYGKYELLCSESREKGSVYLRVPDDEPPAVRNSSPAGSRSPLATCSPAAKRSPSRPTSWCSSPAWCRARTASWSSVLKLPVGNDGFFNEIHPKLRPVETVVDGVYICGACQSPKNSAESGGLRPGGRHAKRRHPEARLRRARPDGGAGRYGRLHLVRQVPGSLPLRCPRAGRGRRQGGRRCHPARPARAAAAACRCVPPKRSTCRATPTPRSRP